MTKFSERPSPFPSPSNDLTQLLESGIGCDASIEVGEAPETDIYKVHLIILQSRSSYFQKVFDEIAFNGDDVKVLKLPNISNKVFDVWKNFTRKIGEFGHF
ncbi:hypothetical protein Glove_61g11 [Diversispora epigaea]|uniref:BTB domain-containing protein n=1 Tax=Diversispora epigaea TaxID=1348612 RepID=A0A397JCF1_9GLOM|nr:hypothetical protein Glove_61g11 [Diversispora epigaea]